MCCDVQGGDCTTKNNEKKSSKYICPICLRLYRDITNFMNRANSGKLVLPGMVYSIFIIIIIGMKKTHMLLINF